MKFMNEGQRRNYDVSFDAMDAMELGVERAIQYAVSGLLCEGEHHKQWCLEKVF